MLATVPQLAAYLNVTGDDERLAALLIEAEAALKERHGMPTIGSAVSTRTYPAEGYIVWVRDCSEVTAVADENGSALSFTEVHGTMAYDPLRWIRLDSPHDGHVTVTGTFGLAATPPSVARAIVVTAAAWYRRQTVGAEGNYIGGLDAIPREADHLMRSWRGWV